MLVEERQALCSKDTQETAHDEDETISLCDLTLYNDRSAEWHSLDQSNAANSSSYFEFFNQELEAPVTTPTDFTQETIVFCGKLIPYKQANDDKTRDLVRCRGRLSCNTESGSRSTTPIQKKGMYSINEIGKGHKMSILTSSSSGKGKWYFFLFGISRSSTEVELRDMRSRRSCRRRSSPPHPQPPAIFGSRNWNEDVSGSRHRGWWLWWLIRALSCGGNHHSATRLRRR